MGEGFRIGVSKLSESAKEMIILIRLPVENLYAVGLRSNTNSTGSSAGIGLRDSNTNLLVKYVLVGP